MPNYKSCLNCSEPFEVYRSYHIYCSNNCNQLYWRSVNKDSIKVSNYKAKLKPYGLTPKVFEEMCEQVDNKCEICGVRPDYRLHIDHCHKTGRIRGLLCRECNLGLGFFRDSPEILQEAVSYAQIQVEAGKD